MRQPAAWAPIVIVTAVCGSSACATGGSATKWSKVEHLKPGSSVRVLVDDQAFVERRFVSADASSLVVAAGDRGTTESVPADRVVMITKAQRAHPKRNGAIIGGVIGIFHGLLATQGLSCSDCPWKVAGMMAFDSALDASIGAFLMRKKPPYDVIYQRPK